MRNLIITTASKVSENFVSNIQNDPFVRDKVLAIYTPDKLQLMCNILIDRTEIETITFGEANYRNLNSGVILLNYPMYKGDLLFGNITIHIYVDQNGYGVSETHIDDLSNNEDPIILNLNSVFNIGGDITVHDIPTMERIQKVRALAKEYNFNEESLYTVIFGSM